MKALDVDITPIITDSGQSIISSTSKSVSLSTYTNNLLTYTPGASYTSDVNYQTNQQVYSLIQCTNAKIIPDLPCSISGSTTISHITADYLMSAVPSWVSIDSSTGELTVSSPWINSDKEFSFYIYSTISGFTNQIKKIIKLKIISCSITNWMKCPSNISIWEIWNDGYSLISNKWIQQNSSSNTNNNSTSSIEEDSEMAKALSISITSIVGLSSIVVIAMSLSNTSSIASLWSMVNQLQMYLLLLITRAFLPDEVISIIKGFKFTSNLYDYFPIRKTKLWQNIFDYFAFDLTNPLLDYFELNSDSTVYNSYPIFITLIMIMLTQLFIFMIRFLFQNWRCSRNWTCIAKIMIWVMTYYINFMTFGFYIRNIIEISQFILVSLTNELYIFNVSNSLRIISILFAICLLISFIVFLLSIFLVSISTYKLSENEHNIFAELFIGLKHQK